MSYALEFAPDAKLQWRELDVLLQELVLDELEKLAADVLPAGPIIRDFVIDGQGGRIYVFITVIRDGERLSVLGISQFTRRA